MLRQWEPTWLPSCPPLPIAPHSKVLRFYPRFDLLLGFFADLPQAAAPALTRQLGMGWRNPPGGWEETQELLGPPALSEWMRSVAQISVGFIYGGR